jgi:hypothetical protein
MNQHKGPEMARRRSKKTTRRGFLTTGAFLHILERKYGLTIPKDELIHALAAPNTIVTLTRVPVPTPKLILEEKPPEDKSPRLSYLNRERRRKQPSMSVSE